MYSVAKGTRVFHGTINSSLRGIFEEGIKANTSSHATKLNIINHCPTVWITSHQRKAICVSSTALSEGRCSLPIVLEAVLPKSQTLIFDPDYVTAGKGVLSTLLKDIRNKQDAFDYLLRDPHLATHSWENFGSAGLSDGSCISPSSIRAIHFPTVEFDGTLIEPDVANIALGMFCHTLSIAPIDEKKIGVTKLQRKWLGVGAQSSPSFSRRMKLDNDPSCLELIEELVFDSSKGLDPDAVQHQLVSYLKKGTQSLPICDYIKNRCGADGKTLANQLAFGRHRSDPIPVCQNILDSFDDNY
mmetsp:Transcript_16863/g.19414  ORF Transcript_16863/g.19414 Transcript_16863/m.19414 type:complete len:300 (+) Transcript_16863:99-998(+)